MVRAALLSIGDELLCGEIVDSNAPHIASRLFGAGFRVVQKRSVGDDLEAIAKALAELAGASDAVIVTGGLGPTSDDVTAAAAARATGHRLLPHPQALAHLQEFSGRLPAGLHPENERQALLPEGAELLDNPLGTACGFSVRLYGARLFFLPGVPFEMERMLEESVLPGLLREFPAATGFCRKTLKLFGISEAAAGAVLRELLLPPAVELAYCVRFPEVQLILRAPGEAQGELDLAAGLIREKLGTHIFAEDAQSLDSALALLFATSGATLALAESCTGGMIASRITALPGSSAYFLEGAVTYSNAAKSRLLQVPARLIEQQGAVSPEVAGAMAEGARAASGATLALSVTGIAGPEGGSPEKPVGTVFIALADACGCRVQGYRFPGDRERVRLITCFTALDWLRRHLLLLPKQS